MYVCLVFVDTISIQSLCTQRLITRHVSKKKKITTVIFLSSSVLSSVSKCVCVSFFVNSETLNPIIYKKKSRSNKELS